MKIRPVAIDKKVKKQYISIDEKIISLDRAINLFPSYKSKILKISNIKSKRIANKIIPVEYPGNYEIAKLIKDECKKIFEVLEIKKYKKDIQKSALIFNYLIKNLNYDESISEQKIKDAELLEIRDEILIKDKKLSFINKKMKWSKGLGREIIKHQFKKEKQELEKLENTYKEKDIIQEDTNGLRAIYNALILKKGVCEDYSYAYSYLLQKAQVFSYFVITQNQENNEEGHAFTIQELEHEDEGIVYFISDITIGNHYIKQNPNDEILPAFFMTKDNFNAVHPNEKIINMLEFKVSKNLKQSKSLLDYYDYLTTDEVEDIKSQLQDKKLWKEDIKQIKQSIFQKQLLTKQQQNEIE